ncbi:DUF5367 family protein [Allomuricauda sp. SCSIO 65647]|uniref:DUF5367 family protein n=1 Tax=Allomuricauda sp. SCSIO 65647 TaxID=2908843 RepID=UPI001F40A41C|nr:DUF5367 family protein [Muricauda sp. SCSIO 65647]UJH66441.1 DUF5367 domain-containing protein [Muricauda sp. SCSIO 65647]
MKIVRAIWVGVLIWFLGVLSFSISFYIPVMENTEQQANLILFIAIVPIVWLGSSLYYGKGIDTHGLKTGITFFFIAAALDALITVPMLVIPYGGSHYEFFTDIGFWLIGLEFVSTTVLYWYFKIKRTREFI